MDLNEETSTASDDSLLFKWAGHAVVAFIVGAPALTMFKILILDKFVIPHLSQWFSFLY